MEKRLQALAAAAVMCLAAPASAQFYGGLGAGPSRIDIDCAGADTCDRTDTGYKLYGGWELAGPFAVEALYLDWGRARASATPVEAPPASLSTRVRGLGLAGVYIARFGWGTCVARLGVASNRARTTVTLGTDSASDSFNHTAPLYGFGCFYPITPGVAISADLDFSRAKYTAQDKANLRLFSVGLRF